MDPLIYSFTVGLKETGLLFFPQLGGILIFLNVAIILEKCRIQSAGKNNFQTKEKREKRWINNKNFSAEGHCSFTVFYGSMAHKICLSFSVSDEEKPAFQYLFVFEVHLFDHIYSQSVSTSFDHSSTCIPLSCIFDSKIHKLHCLVCYTSRSENRNDLITNLQL